MKNNYREELRMAVKGVDILVLVETTTPGTYIEVGGQRGATLSESNETIETTHKGSNGYKEFEYGYGEWTISADGLYISSDTGYERLVECLRNKTKVKVRWTEGGTQVFEGTALVTSRELEGPFDGEATFSVEFQGTGAPIAV
jgi:TP901-1 family phage major tail protein